MFLIEEVVKITDDHESNEVFSDVNDCQRLCNDHIVVEQRDQNNCRSLQKTSEECELVVLESPKMIQRVFHFGHTFLQLIGHGNVHHDTRDEPGKCDITGGHRYQIEVVIIVLILDESEERHLEAKDQ